jgi:hypothetical protein
MRPKWRGGQDPIAATARHGPTLLAILVIRIVQTR